MNNSQISLVSLDGDKSSSCLAIKLRTIYNNKPSNQTQMNLKISCLDGAQFFFQVNKLNLTCLVTLVLQSNFLHFCPSIQGGVHETLNLFHEINFEPLKPQQIYSYSMELPLEIAMNWKKPIVSYQSLKRLLVVGFKSLPSFFKTNLLNWGSADTTAWRPNKWDMKMSELYLHFFHYTKKKIQKNLNKQNSKNKHPVVAAKVLWT